MSDVAILEKIQYDCRSIEDEIKKYKESESMGKACDRIIEYIRNSQEPFCITTKTAEKNTNPWHVNSGDDGCCIIS